MKSNIIWEIEKLLLKNMKDSLIKYEQFKDLEVYSTVPYKFTTPYLKIKSISSDGATGLENIEVNFDIMMVTSSRNNRSILEIAQAMDYELGKISSSYPEGGISNFYFVPLGYMAEEIVEHQTWIGNYKLKAMATLSDEAD